MLICALVLTVRPALLDHAFAQWSETPAMRIEDAYKWLFHATLGGEHAITSVDGPRAWLDREWASLGPPMKSEQEAVPLTPDSSVIRVNIRPFRHRGGNKEMLLWAFVLSAERFKSDKSLFVKQWDALGERLESRPWRSLTNAEWRRLDARTRDQGFPAIHHSRSYEDRYKPAYRVVLAELWTVYEPAFFSSHSTPLRMFP